MNERLYYNDPFLTEFSATVTEVTDGGLRVYLDRSAFYPSSGGQPNDLGTLGGIAVTDVVDEEGRVAHVLAWALPADVRSIEGRVDWARRLDHMQQHTGQHLLSAVLHDLYSAPTLSFHLGQESSTIEIGLPALTADQVRSAERRANELIWENRAVAVTYEDAEEVAGLRKASERTGTLRIVNIEDYDRSACGGTHVRSTSAIGLVLIRKLDKIRGNVRVEFLCGSRALRATRTDYETLNEIGRALSSPSEQTPGLVTNLLARANDLEKSRRKLAVELATFQGRQLYENTAEEGGYRRVGQRHASGPASDELRALAQSFTSGAKATFVAIFENPPSLLLAASKDSGVHAGDVLKKVLTQAGGRGGGNAQLAQGSVTSQADLASAAEQLAQALPPSQ